MFAPSIIKAFYYPKGPEQDEARIQKTEEKSRRQRALILNIYFLVNRVGSLCFSTEETCPVDKGEVIVVYLRLSCLELL